MLARWALALQTWIAEAQRRLTGTPAWLTEASTPGTKRLISSLLSEN
jgi:hypothetical protein